MGVNIWSNDSDDKEDVRSNADDDDFEDDVIDETKNTPIIKPSTFNLAKVKLEGSNDVKNSDLISMETPAAEGATSKMTNPSISNGQVMSTQTDCGMAVKVEDDQQRREETEIKKEETKNDTTAMEQSSNEVECGKDKDTEINSFIKDSMETERCNSADIQSKPSLLEGSNQEKDDPSHMPKQTSMNSFLKEHHIQNLEVQKQQDSLLELMDATALERDEFKKQAQYLALELEKKEVFVNLLFKELRVKKETVDETDYKTLYLQTTQHNEQRTQTIHELKKKQEENKILVSNKK